MTAFDQLKAQIGNRYVSTVKLAFSFNAGEYETMVFKCNRDGKVRDFRELYVLRASNAIDAERNHAEAIAWAEEN